MNCTTPGASVFVITSVAFVSAPLSESTSGAFVLFTVALASQMFAVKFEVITPSSRTGTYRVRVVASPSAQVSVFVNPA